MLKVRRLLHDLRRMLAGIATFVHELGSGETATVGLGQFSAESSAAVRGGQNRYRVTVSSVAAEPRDVTLVIDIYAAESPNPGHYAHFSKRLRARPRVSMPVEVDYDWATAARFVVSGLPLAPDDFWRGTLDRSSAYAVHALLLDGTGKRRELLTVYQQLMP